MYGVAHVTPALTVMALVDRWVADGRSGLFDAVVYPGASIDLTVVVPTVGTVTGDLLPTARLVPNSTKAALNVEEEGLHDYVAQLIGRLEAQEVHATGSVLRGETVQTLADAAEESAADLIIIATHARAGLDATLTGSIAASLIGRVTQPVLMVKIV